MEAESEPVGLVEAIAGLNSWHIHARAKRNHAGTTQLLDRRDALIPAAVATLDARQRMREILGLLATVGDVHVDGASNIVPGATHFSLDVRGTDREAIEAAVRQVLDASRRSAAEAGCEVHAELARALPGELGGSILAAIRQSVPQGRPFPTMARMAGRDAINLAAAGVPCGMIFVRPRGKVRHCPREHSSAKDRTQGARLLAELPTPLVDPARVISGRPPPDGIPPIDEPRFVRAEDVDWLTPDEPVLAPRHRRDRTRLPGADPDLARDRQ